jgi:PKD repeat protein
VKVSDLNDLNNSAMGYVDVFVISAPADYLPVHITDFSASTYVGLGPLDVDFTLLAAGGSDSYVFEWDFGDGSTSSSKSPAHTFLEPGRHSVSVKVSDFNDPNNSAMGTVDILVISAPEELAIDLSVTENSDGNPLHVDIEATIVGGGAPYTVNVNYGDGTSDEFVVDTSLAQISHIYQTPGIYNVSAIITSSNSAGANLVTLGSRQVSIIANDVARNDAGTGGGGGSFGLWMIVLLLFRLLVPSIRTA